MALSAFAFTEDCIPPNNFVDLAYHPSAPNNLNNTPFIGSTYSSDLSLALGSNLTIPTSCGTGMDVVFLVDYTGSMANAIEGVKTGINNILSTIDTESNGNYRVGLCIFDETQSTYTSPINYGTNINYTSLPSAQKVEISTNANRKQWITCLETLGTVGSTNTFVNQLNKLNGALPLGTGQNYPEPGGLAVNEIVSNSIAGSFRSESSKIIILITDAVPGGDDDYNNLIDDNYFNNVLTPLCDSYNVQVMIQSTLASNFQNNFYYDLSQGTTPIGRYDQVTFDISGNWINSGLIQGIEGICGSTYTHTCNDAPTGWYHEEGSDYAWYFNNSTGTITNSFSFPPSYNVIAIPGTAGEDNVTITFMVSTGYVPNGTTLYWNMSNGNTDANDFTNNIHYGSFTINSEGFGSFTLTTKPDNITDGVESLIVTLRTGSVFGTIVATSNTVKILDSSLSPTPTPTPSPTPTATPSPTAIPTGTCQNTWIHPNVNPSKYGLRWKKPSGEYITARFRDMLSTPTWRNGIEGYVISVCSNEAVQAFNFEVGDSAFLSTDLFARLASGGTCVRDRDCIYDAPSPTATPYPTATPTEEWIYELSSCNSEQPNVKAKSNTQKIIGGKYELTGSSYQSGTPWTIIRVSSGFAPTWIGNVSRDACDDSGECLLEGTQIKLPNGTSTQIETLKVGDTLASNNIGNMPNTDNVLELLTWEETDPLVSSTTTTIVGIELNTVNRVLNFNQGLLTSTVAHLHIIKRDNLWMVTQAINIKEGDIFINDNGTEHIISSIEDMSGTFNTYKIDVEENDTYIANEIITHNRKLEGIE